MPAHLINKIKPVKTAPPKTDPKFQKGKEYGNHAFLRKRNAFKGRYFQHADNVTKLLGFGYTISDIAEHLNITRGTVRRIIRRTEKVVAQVAGTNLDAHRDRQAKVYYYMLKELQLEYEASKFTSKGVKCKPDLNILRQMVEVNEKIIQLFGLAAPQKVEVDNKPTQLDWRTLIIHPNNNTASIPNNDNEIEAKIKQLQEYKRDNSAQTSKRIVVEE